MMDCMIFVSFVSGLIVGSYLWHIRPSWRRLVLIIAGIIMIVLSKYTARADPKDVGNNAWLLDLTLIGGVAFIFFGICLKKQK